jgi:hypothetical protein
VRTQLDFSSAIEPEKGAVHDASRLREGLPSQILSQEFQVEVPGGASRRTRQDFSIPEAFPPTVGLDIYI